MDESKFQRFPVDAKEAKNWAAEGGKRLAAAKPRVERATRSVRQRPKVVVERVVFLHDDDYVLDLVQATIAKRLPWHERHEHESRQQSASQNPEPSHSAASSITAGVFGPRAGTLLSLSYSEQFAFPPGFRIIRSPLPIAVGTK